MLKGNNKLKVNFETMMAIVAKGLNGEIFQFSNSVTVTNVHRMESGAAVVFEISIEPTPKPVTPAKPETKP